MNKQTVIADIQDKLGMESSNVETIIKRYEAQLSFLQARDYGIAEIAISAAIDAQFPD